MLHRDGSRLAIVEEIVVEGDLALFGLLDVSISSTTLQVILYTHGIVDVKKHILKQLDIVVLRCLATLHGDAEHAECLGQRGGALSCEGSAQILEVA